MYKSKLAPVVLFVYNRLFHTKMTIDALKENYLASETDLFIFSDGGRDADSWEKVQDIRNYLNTIYGFKKVEIVHREQNLGLARNIISGVSEVISHSGKVIVLEDDIVSSKGFLKYMNEALTLYENNQDVGCVHAWNYNLDKDNYPHSTFFLKGADCWGWATWDRSWQFFNGNGSELLEIIKKRKLEYEFNRRGSHAFVSMLEEQVKGINDSWAVRWHASLFIHDMYCLHPTQAIVKNIGLDNSGTHCGPLNLNQEPVDSIEISQIKVQEIDWFFDAFEQLEKTENIITLWQRLKTSLGRLFRQ